MIKTIGNSKPFDWCMDIIFNLFAGRVSSNASSIETSPVAIGRKIFQIASRIDAFSSSGDVKIMFAEYLLKNPVCVIDWVMASR